MLCSKLYILTELNDIDVKYTSVDRKNKTFQKMHTYGTLNSIFVVVQPHSTNIKNDPRKIIYLCEIILNLD